MNCPHCHSNDIDYNDASTSCRKCGLVLEESQIVSDVTFAENSAGGAVVQGSYVGNEQRECVWCRCDRHAGADRAESICQVALGRRVRVGTGVVGQEHRASRRSPMVGD